MIERNEHGDISYEVWGKLSKTSYIKNVAAYIVTIQHHVYICIKLQLSMAVYSMHLRERTFLAGFFLNNDVINIGCDHHESKHVFSTAVQP